MRILILALTLTLATAISNAEVQNTFPSNANIADVINELDDQDRQPRTRAKEGLARVDGDGKCWYLTPGRLTIAVSCVHELTKGRLANVLLLTLIDAGEALVEGYISQEEYGYVIGITLVTYQTYKSNHQENLIERVKEALEFYEDALAESGVDTTYIQSPRTALFETNLFMEAVRVRRLRGHDIRLPE